ncbi:hypothetical protein DENSPDRAFT_885367 [Dentipellis sp. KUC8613]|nr:hypothetical protein DENSPDRAFT_885367 [Dentipellis sp. KUC8613]
MQNFGSGRDARLKAAERRPCPRASCASIQRPATRRTPRPERKGSRRPQRRKTGLRRPQEQVSNCAACRRRPLSCPSHPNSHVAATLAYASQPPSLAPPSCILPRATPCSTRTFSRPALAYPSSPRSSSPCVTCAVWCPRRLARTTLTLLLRRSLAPSCALLPPLSRFTSPLLLALPWGCTPLACAVWHSRRPARVSPAPLLRRSCALSPPLSCPTSLLSFVSHPPSLVPPSFVLAPAHTLHASALSRTLCQCASRDKRDGRRRQQRTDSGARRCWGHHGGGGRIT